MKPLATLLCVALVSLTAHAEPPAMKLINDTVIDPAAWNFPDGQYGTTVNGQTFQQEAVISFKGWQYASYFADGGVLAVARRKLPDGAWQTIHFVDYTARDHRDAHNVASIGLCGADGTIHLMFDHHCDPLHYRRSVQKLASEPEKFEWKAENFGPVTDALEARKPLKNLTYPQLFSAPGGKLQVMYRLGTSGDGDWYLAEYDGSAAGAWSTVGMVLSREGAFKSSPSRCAYPNPLRYDSAGHLHMTWCWREIPKDAPFDLRTNHDLMYAYSEDAGRTWKNNGGGTVADITGANVNLPKTIGIGTMGIVVSPTKWLWGQMNTNTQCIDAKGRVHFISWQLPNEAKEGTKDPNAWKYFHYWRDEKGTWHENRLPFVGRKPQIVLDKDCNAVVVYCTCDNADYHGSDPGGKLAIMTATEAGHWKDWKPAASIDRLSVGEPLIDQARWASEGVLSIYLQDKPAAAGKASSLRIIDFK